MSHPGAPAWPDHPSSFAQLLVSALREAVVVTDADGVVTYWNDGAARVFGWTADERLGRRLVDRLPEREREEVAAQMRSILSGNEWHGECQDYRKDGTRVWLEASIRPLRADDGTVVGILGIAEDITARKDAETVQQEKEKGLAEQVRQSQKMEAIGRLAGGMAHDFNNLLTVINGYTNLLLDNAPSDAAQREALEAVRDAGERAAALTAQLLTFSRKAVVEPRVIDLNRATESALRLLRRLVGEDIHLSTEFASFLPTIRIDPGQLEQVLMNLVVNGRDAMPAGGRLRIATSEVRVPASWRAQPLDLPAGRYVRLTVADTGDGMDENVLSHIFEPFYTTKAVGKGTGLGLATVYGIVRQAGGTITVESAVGRGSTFHVLLPAVDGDVEPGEVRSRQATPRGHETLLLVEDEGAVRRFARLALEMQGYQVIEAASAREALSLAPETLAGVSLLVTDVIMPVTSGRDLAVMLKRRYPLMRVLLMSGYTNDVGGPNDAEAFLQKPFTPQALARKVRDVLQ